MAQRLPVDANVVAYWGFDEANETDPAIDEGLSARHLTVANSPQVLPARVNNGRQFNGSSTYAFPASSEPFRISAELTLIAWIILDQVNTSGSLMRTVLECAGAGGAQPENCLYGLFVSNVGELVYRHEFGAGQLVELKTAPGTIKTGRYYSLALVRERVDATTCEVCLYLDNQECGFAVATVAGVPQPVDQPVPWPDGGTNAAFKVGKSDQFGDGAFWHGTLDEFSIHDVERTYSPYLRSVYFQLTLYTLFFRLTVFNNVRSVGGTEMGGGERWWVYERDNSLYAIRENTLGLFSQEVPLTTGGLQPNGTVAPGGTERPALIYDKANDVLLVAFINSGRVFKLTAGVGDAPATQAMPYTVDTAGIVKVRDNNEGVRLGAGFHQNGPTPTTFDRSPMKYGGSDNIPLGAGTDLPVESFQKRLGIIGNATTLWSVYQAPTTISFTSIPSFGIFIPWTSAYGFAVYRHRYGVEELLGYVEAAGYDATSRYGGFFPITERHFGAWYYVKPLDPFGAVRTQRSNLIIDLLGLVEYAHPVNRPTLLTYDRDGDDPQVMPLGAGYEPHALKPTFLNRTPIKIPLADPAPLGAWSVGRLGINTSPSPTAPQRRRLELA